MSPDDQRRWIDPRHFEVVEVHVMPERQRRGIGRLLIGALLDGLDVPFALLSTDEGNERARAFYAAMGWREIVSGVDLSSPRGPYVVLARELTSVPSAR
jgi:ribosomal protein S18 acetylase RimI-like enzyme